MSSLQVARSWQFVSFFSFFLAWLSPLTYFNNVWLKVQNSLGSTEVTSAIKCETDPKSKGWSQVDSDKLSTPVTWRAQVLPVQPVNQWQLYFGKMDASIVAISILSQHTYITADFVIVCMWKLKNNPCTCRHDAIHSVLPFNDTKTDQWLINRILYGFDSIKIKGAAILSCKHGFFLVPPTFRPEILGCFRWTELRKSDSWGTRERTISPRFSADYAF